MAACLFRGARPDSATIARCNYAKHAVWSSAARPVHLWCSGSRAGFLAVAKDGDTDRGEQAMKALLANVESLESRNPHVHLQLVRRALTGALSATTIALGNAFVGRIGCRWAQKHSCLLYGVSCFWATCLAWSFRQGLGAWKALVCSGVQQFFVVVWTLL